MGPLAAIASLGGAAALVALRVVAAKKNGERAMHAQLNMQLKRAAHKDTSGASFATTITNCQDLELYVRVWDPQQGMPLRGVVVMVHGMTFHSGYYGIFAKLLSSQGIAVVAYDLQGHGLSDGFQGLRGYFHSYESYVSDAELMLLWAQERYGAVALFLFGESMGGAIALTAARRPHVQAKLRGLILSAPVIKVSPSVVPPKALMPVLATASRLLPRVKIPDDGVIREDNWKAAFGDAVFADRAFRDPLVTLELPRMRAVSLLGSYNANYRNLEDVRTPFIVVHSRTDTRAEFAYSEQLAARGKSHDKKLLEVPGMAHMPFFDKPHITTYVIHELIKWITARC